jgi:hypothetical protein
MQKIVVKSSTKQLFPLGRIVATPAAIDALADWPGRIFKLIARHVSGDWGTVCPEDSRQNDRAVKVGERILSAYAVDPGRPAFGYGDNTVWIITEWDRSVTTVLLPDEY